MKKLFYILALLFTVLGTAQQISGPQKIITVNTATGTPDFFVRSPSLFTEKMSWATVSNALASVYEFNNFAAFPGTGIVGKIYVDRATNIIYRWSGSAYVMLSPFTTQTLQQTTTAGHDTTNPMTFTYAGQTIEIYDSGSGYPVIKITNAEGSISQFGAGYFTSDNGVGGTCFYSSDAFYVRNVTEEAGSLLGISLYVKEDSLNERFEIFRNKIEVTNSNGFKHTFLYTTPTADRTITYQNGSGTVAYLSDITGGGTWGSITGTLSDQTDLQGALDLKEDLSNKTDTMSGNTTSSIKYLSSKGTYDWVNTNYAPITSPNFGTGITTPAVNVSGATASTTAEFDSSKNLVSASKGTAYNKNFGTATSNIAEIGATLGNSQIVETDASGKLITTSKGTAYNKAFGTGTTNVPEIGSTLTNSKVLVTDGSGKLAPSSVTASTMANMDAISPVQAQLDSKAPLTAVSTIKKLTADVTTTIATATVLSDLTFAVTANTTYMVNGVFGIGCNNTGGVSFGVNLPSGTTSTLKMEGRTSSSTAFGVASMGTSGGLSGSLNTVNSTGGYGILFGFINVGATAGNVEIIYASSVAGQTSTVFAATGIEIKKL